MFSSEIKSFQNLKNCLTFSSLDTYLLHLQYLKTWSWTLSRIDNLEFKITKYWDVNDYYLQEKFTKNEDEKILDDAIDLRMVPVGVFLSGGYDSCFNTS